jgi:hypothetical protein
VASLVEQAYRQVAPPRLLASLGAATPSRSKKSLTQKQKRRTG